MEEGSKQKLHPLYPMSTLGPYSIVNKLSEEVTELN